MQDVAWPFVRFSFVFRKILNGVQHWSSGYDVRLTRGRSPVQSWDAVLYFLYFISARVMQECEAKGSKARLTRTPAWLSDLRRRQMELVPKMVGSSGLKMESVPKVNENTGTYRRNIWGFGAVGSA